MKPAPADLEAALRDARNQRDHAGDREMFVFWNLANAQVHERGDPAGAKVVLREGVACSESVADLLVMAAAWRCHFGLDAGFGDVLQVAEARAATCLDWVAIAEETYDGVCTLERGQQPWLNRISGNLERAAALAGTDEDKQAVATGFRSYLGNRARADRIVPSGKAPSALWRAAVAAGAGQGDDAAKGWEPDPSALLTLLRPQVTQAMLKHIAGADYGSDYAKHLAALVECQESGLVPVPLPWCPLEVLSLSQWRQGEGVDHVERAFATTMLLVPCVGADAGDGREQTLAIALDSCLALGRAHVAAFVGLAVAIALAVDPADELALFAWLGVLLGAAHLDPVDARLPALARDLESMESGFAAEGYSRPDHGWLLGTTFFDLRHGLWRRLAARTLGPAVAAQPDADALALVAALLEGEAG